MIYKTILPGNIVYDTHHNYDEAIDLISKYHLCVRELFPGFIRIYLIRESYRCHWCDSKDYIVSEYNEDTIWLEEVEEVNDN